MKIFYLTRDYSPHDYRFLKAIVDGGHVPYFLRMENSGRNLESRPVPGGTEVVSWKGGKKPFRWSDVPGLVLSLKEQIKYFQPDLIHAGPIQTAGLVAALTGFHPLVSISWGFDLMQHADRNSWYRWVTRNVLQKSDWLFGDCNAVLNRAAEFGYDLSRSTYFPWGIDLEQFSPGENASLSTQLGWKDAFCIFCNRSWEPSYGVDLVAQAFVSANKVNPNIRLLLPGSGSQRELIHSIFEAGGVLDKVHMPGQVAYEQLADYYRAADLYISASHTDGSSVSLMEAMACGVPAAVSVIAGNLEWVSPGEQGWIFPDGNAEKLAEIILSASQDRINLAMMSLKARHKAEQQANWMVNQQRMLTGYENVMKHKKPA